MKIKLAIIEDVDDVRQSLKDFFNAQEEITCVLSAYSIDDFFQQALYSEPPDVLLCDIGLPGLNGIEGTKKIRLYYPDILTITLTVFHDSERIFKSLCAGAVGYILKNTSLEEIKKAVIEVYHGGSYISPIVARKVLGYFAPEKTHKKEVLTYKEKQVVTGITEGLSIKLVADKLSVSSNTVKYHLRNIYAKLHINSKGELINKSLKNEI